MLENPSLNIWIEKSVGSTIRGVIEENAHLYSVTTSPGLAEIILFQNDHPTYIRATEEFSKWPHKCIVISETDEPYFFLPACYCSNRSSWLSRGRTETIAYIQTLRENPNPFVLAAKSRTPPKFLYSFQGGATSWVRKKIFKNLPVADDMNIVATNYYQNWNNSQEYQKQKLETQKDYADLLMQSQFFLCPRGAGTGSIRLFEVMKAGVVPVILSDRWVPPRDIPWDEFAVFVPEGGIAQLDAKIRSYASRADEMGTQARLSWTQFCEVGADAATLSRALRRLQSQRNETRERRLRRLFPLLEMFYVLKKGARKTLRQSILKLFALAGRQFPYSLNR